MFQPFTGLYEPSGIRQLPDGRFLVVEDEKNHPFSLATISARGIVSSTPLLPPKQEGADSAWKLDDLEALALDRAGYIYALTSHSRDARGKEKKSRNKLLRFRIAGERMVDPELITGLKPALAAAHPLLAAAAEITDVKSQGGLNIEAMEISADGRQLLIGFRSPVSNDRAIIARVGNAAAVFEADEPPCIEATLVTLELGGQGIRALAHIPALDGYLLASGPVARKHVQFQLWFWSGRPEEPARLVSVAGLPGFEHAEGISPALIDGRQHVIIVSDDGSREARRYARFLLIELDQLLIAPPR